MANSDRVRAEDSLTPDVLLDVFSHRVVYLDTETTGLGAGDRIIDIAVVDADGHTLLDTLVMCSVAISAEATRVHGIKREHTFGAPIWYDVARELNRIIEGKYVVIYNADFDVRMLQQMYALCDLKVLPEQVQFVCAMRWYAKFTGEYNAKRRDYRARKLSEAQAAFTGTPTSSHRALADALACRDVVEGLALQWKEVVGKRRSKSQDEHLHITGQAKLELSV